MGEAALRLLSAIWNVVGILLALIIVIELGLPWLRQTSRRLRYGRGGKPHTRAAADAYGGADWPFQYETEFERLFVLDGAPLVHWKQQPGKGVYTNIDAHGRRIVPGAELAGEEAIRVDCFGGSTMFGIGARDEGTIPALLQRLLRGSGHPVAFVNCAQCGHINTQELIELQQSLKAGERPDIVLFYDGYNDLYTSQMKGQADTIMNEITRSAEFNLLGRERRWDLIRAAFLGAMPRTLRYLRKLTGLELPGPGPRVEFARLGERDLPRLARALVAAYAANVRMIRLLARDYGFQALFVWQPIPASKKVKSPDEQKWDNMGFDVAARRRLLAAVVAEFRRNPELGGSADFLDLSALFDDETKPVYIDYCHLSEEANATVAEAIMPALKRAVIAAEAKRHAGAMPAGGGLR